MGVVGARCRKETRGGWGEKKSESESSKKKKKKSRKEKSERNRQKRRRNKPKVGDSFPPTASSCGDCFVIGGSSGGRGDKLCVLPWRRGGGGGRGEEMDG